MAAPDLEFSWSELRPSSWSHKMYYNYRYEKVWYRTMWFLVGIVALPVIMINAVVVAWSWSRDDSVSNLLGKIVFEPIPFLAALTLILIAPAFIIAN